MSTGLISLAAGVLIGLMALLKIGAAGLHAPLFVTALLYSLIYGLGFVLIYLLGLTVATKQPAMTAQTLAAQLAELRPNRQAEVERLVDVAAAVSRSQLAAILGNVLVAAPMALLLSALFTAWHGAPPVDMAKAQHLLADLDPLSWALPHAAIAGFYLFLSGLITGFFANQAAYDDIGARHDAGRDLGDAADLVAHAIHGFLGLGPADGDDVVISRGRLPNNTAAGVPGPAEDNDGGHEHAPLLVNQSD